MAEHDNAFAATLSEFLKHLASRFPDRPSLGQTASMADMMLLTPMGASLARKTWADSSATIVDQIMARDLQAVLQAQKAMGGMVSSLPLEEIMTSQDVDQQTKDSLWQYFQVLTVIAHQDSGVSVPAMPTTTISMPSSPASPAVGATSAAAPVSAAPASAAPATAQGPDVDKMVDGFTKALPKVSLAVKKLMDDEDNPMGQMIRQMLNPGQVQPGVANNLAAAYLQEPPPSVMEEVQEQMGEEISAAELVEKLKRLERFEKMREKRKSRGG